MPVSRSASSIVILPEPEAYLRIEENVSVLVKITIGANISLPFSATIVVPEVFAT